MVMDSATTVYVNTRAEGARIGPQELNEQNIEFAANMWRRNKTVIHVKLMGKGRIQSGEMAKDVLIGNIGVAKIYLPFDQAALDRNQEPLTLTRHLVAVTIDAVDTSDEGNRVLLVNREAALESLRRINENRINVDDRAYGVVQRVVRGGYILNVGGYRAYLPRRYYDWDRSALANVGDEFEVLILPSQRRQMMYATLETNPPAIGKTLAAFQSAATPKTTADLDDTMPTEDADDSTLSLSSAEDSNEEVANDESAEEKQSIPSEIATEPVVAKLDTVTQPETPTNRSIVVSRRDLIVNPYANMNFHPGETVVGRISFFTRSARVMVEVAQNVYVNAGGFFTTHRAPSVGELVEVKINRVRAGNVFGNVMRTINDSTERLISYR